MFVVTVNCILKNKEDVKGSKESMKTNTVDGSVPLQNTEKNFKYLEKKSRLGSLLQEAEGTLLQRYTPCPTGLFGKHRSWMYLTQSLLYFRVPPPPNLGLQHSSESQTYRLI